MQPVVEHASGDFIMVEHDILAQCDWMPCAVQTPFYSLCTLSTLCAFEHEKVIVDATDRLDRCAQLEGLLKHRALKLEVACIVAALQKWELENVYLWKMSGIVAMPVESILTDTAVVHAIQVKRVLAVQCIAVLLAAFKRVKLLGPSITHTSHTLPCPSQTTRTRNVHDNIYSTLSPVKTSLNPKNVRVYVNIWQLWGPFEQCGPRKMQRMLYVLLCVCYEAFVCLCLEVTIANPRRSVCVYARRLTVRITGGLQSES